MSPAPLTPHPWKLRAPEPTDDECPPHLEEWERIAWSFPLPESGGVNHKAMLRTISSLRGALQSAARCAEDAIQAARQSERAVTDERASTVEWLRKRGYVVGSVTAQLIEAGEHRR